MRHMVGHTDTATAPGMTVLAETSRKYQSPPPLIPIPTTAPTLLY